MLDRVTRLRVCILSQCARWFRAAIIRNFKGLAGDAECRQSAVKIHRADVVPSFSLYLGVTVNSFYDFTLSSNAHNARLCVRRRDIMHFLFHRGAGITRCDSVFKHVEPVDRQIMHERIATRSTFRDKSQLPLAAALYYSRVLFHHFPLLHG